MYNLIFVKVLSRYKNQNLYKDIRKDRLVAFIGLLVFLLAKCFSSAANLTTTIS